MKKHSNIRIFYESESFLLAEKPPGIPVHATKDSKRENFTDQLQKQLSLEYLRTVNRLDLDTSGLVFFCKNPNKNKEADQILKNSLKIYLCVTSGVIPEKHFTETCYIKDGNKKVRKVFSGGDKAVTEFLTLKQNSKENYSVLLAKLHTGKRHQIRFHLSEKGYPILGDCVYGKNNKSKLLLRPEIETENTIRSSNLDSRLSANKNNTKEPKFISSIQTKNKILEKQISLEKNSNEFRIKTKKQNSSVKRTLLHAIGFAFQTEEKIFCPPPPDFQNFLDDVILDFSIFSKFSLR
ncbi:MULTISPECIES: pseudouridine synthase family protein [Leptospira]|uniref:RNA pseudouridine synthase n=1 Tax=Leptospira kirschneri serovar Pomona TaxID=561005 RepID=A0A1T1DJ01_9LEPT|nr:MULTISPECIES: RNA pseudouridine synthase [Leptospira]EMK04185.1 RNA pseudouridine synthase [Leptospira kirschneri]KXZ21386.1 RNA pseudouridine synthase [Leptospira kirschneri]KXZ25810.1 RNA pseudouridine synthase [Leptospira sp. ZV016]OOV40834.1 RNA pseudouridine synthase [Leptospira kirschneri serovar Pomona]